MAQESKPVDPVKEAAEAEDRKEIAAGKKPAVDSDDEEDDDAPEDAAEPGTSGAAGTAPASKKKKSKRKKVKAALTGKPADPQAEISKALGSLPPDQVAELLRLNPALAQELPNAAGESSSSGASAADALKRLNLHDIMTGLAVSGKNAKDMASYKFWQTQPVPKFDEAKEKGQIEEGPLKIQKVEDVPQQPSKMVEGFEWDTVDLTDAAQLKEVYDLLTGHFVEDTEAMFRFKYSTSILKW